jgi:hypothetical protein
MGLGDWLKERAAQLVESRWDRIPRAHPGAHVRQNEYGFDPFGFSKDSLKYGCPRQLPLPRLLPRETQGSRTSRGRVLLCSNHSGQLPFDAHGHRRRHAHRRAAAAHGAQHGREVHPDPALRSYIFSALGQITGTPENCRRLLEDGEAILVFPEGAKGISKPFTRRYQLQEFGLGFMRLALQTGTPIVPVAVIGAEEQAPAVNVKSLARSSARRPSRSCPSRPSCPSCRCP